MNLEEILSMAKEASTFGCCNELTGDVIIRFAKLVAAHEREECAKVCEAEHVGNSVEDKCDNKGDEGYNMALRHAGASIRARGNPA